MSAELAVVGGLGFISAIFAYYAFQLRESGEELNQKIGVFLFFMSLLFADLLMFTIYQLTQETASLNFLTGSVMHTGLLVVIWVTVGLTTVLLFSLLLMVITVMWEWYKKASGKHISE